MPALAPAARRPVVLGLACAVVVLWGYIFARLGGMVTAPPPAAPAPVVADAPPPAPPRAAPFRGGFRDPFRQPAAEGQSAAARTPPSSSRAPPAAAARWQLQGVVGRTALLARPDGTLCLAAPADTCGGLRLVELHPDRALVALPDTTLILALSPADP